MKTVGVAMLGRGFMGQAHSRALAAMSTMAEPPPAIPRLVSICGRDAESLERALADDRVAVFDNVAPNSVHVEPCLAAIAAGKHVMCEKPLATSAADARRMLRGAEQAGVVHMCGFNLRFLPAVRLSRELVDRGAIGEVTHFRGRFLASSALRADQRRTWRFDRAGAGSGAVADLGSHLVDLGRYLAGEPVAVSAATRTFVPVRGGQAVDVDDAFAAVVEFEGGAVGTLEASRAAGRRSNDCAFEVDGTLGSLAFDVERLNALDLIDERKRRTRIEVTAPGDPFMNLWWPAPGHAIGWGDTFVHELRHLLAAVAGRGSVRPHGADFEDGFRCATVCDAILRAADTGRRVEVRYR